MESVTDPSVMSPFCPACLMGNRAPKGVGLGPRKRTMYFCCDDCGHRWQVTDYRSCRSPLIRRIATSIGVPTYFVTLISRTRGGCNANTRRRPVRVMSASHD